VKRNILYVDGDSKLEVSCRNDQISTTSWMESSSGLNASYIGYTAAAAKKTLLVAGSNSASVSGPVDMCTWLCCC
jgi:hypothetical protein